MSTPTEVRVAVWRNGFSPIACNGKAPVAKGWQQRHETNAAQIELDGKLYPYAASTGVLTKATPAADIDITIPPAAEAIEALAREVFEEHGVFMVRIGEPPKRAILFRTDEPFEKTTAAFTSPDGGQHKIEVLGDGQQVIVDGIHPGTGKPYAWHGGSPLSIPREELPYVRREDMIAFLAQAAELLIKEFGFQPIGAKPKANGADHDDGQHERVDWTTRMAGIIAGRDLHENLNRLGASFRHAMGTEPAIRALQALMLASPTPHDERWTERFNDIPRSVRGAEEKHGAEAVEPKQEVTQSAEPNGLDVIDAGVDDWNVPPREWLLGNMFCREFISSLLGDGGTGKTALRYPQYISLAIYRSLTGEHVFERCRVLVLSLEDSINELRRRMMAACLHHGVSQAELTGWLFYAAIGAGSGKLMTTDAKGRPVVGPLAASLEKIISEKRIDLVALDPFIKTHSVEENHNSAIDGVVQVLSDLAVKHSIAIDLPHHVSKGAPDPGNANRGRGASAMKDAARLVHTLSTMTDEEAKAMGVSEAERRSLIRLDSGKVNIAPAAHEAKWFRLVGVQLGNSTERYPNGDSVQTVEPWRPRSIWSDLSVEDINYILDRIKIGTPDGQRYSAHPNAKTRAAWPIIVKWKTDTTEVAAKKIIKKWLESGLLTEEEYFDEKRRETMTGLVVDDSKRLSCGYGTPARTEV